MRPGVLALTLARGFRSSWDVLNAHGRFTFTPHLEFRR
jgi:hypothetical protein